MCSVTRGTSWSSSVRTPERLDRRGAHHGRMSFGVVRPDEFEWITRPHEPGEPARHVAELSDRLGVSHVRANVWRYEPGAKGRRHRHPTQEETFVVLSGALSMYLGEPPERVDVPA